MSLLQFLLCFGAIAAIDIELLPSTNFCYIYNGNQFENEKYINYERRDGFGDKLKFVMSIEDPNHKISTFELHNDLGSVSYWFTSDGTYKVCLMFEHQSEQTKTEVRTVDIAYWISTTKGKNIEKDFSVLTDVDKLKELSKYVEEIKTFIKQVNRYQEKSLHSIKLFKDEQVSLSDEICYFTIFECLLVLIAGSWEVVSLRQYFKNKHIK